MECKAESQKSKSNLYVYWNISRMECKGENKGYGMRGRSPLEYIQNGM